MVWYVYFLLISLFWLFLWYKISNKYFNMFVWFISQILLWLSLWITDYFFDRWGFPIKAFIYPICSPCGSDYPNKWSFSLFLLNRIFRIIVSILMSYFIYKNKKRNIRLCIITFFIIMFWLLYLLLRFD